MIWGARCFWTSDTNVKGTLAPPVLPCTSSQKTPLSLRQETSHHHTAVKSYIHRCITRSGCPLFVVIGRPTNSPKSAVAPVYCTALHSATLAPPANPVLSLKKREQSSGTNHMSGQRLLPKPDAAVCCVMVPTKFCNSLTYWEDSLDGKANFTF